MNHLITSAKIITPTQTIDDGWIWVHDDKITTIGRGEPPELHAVQVVDARGLTLLPGFIDLHVHGAMNYEAMDAYVDGLRNMAEFYAQHGVTSFLPTTWTDTRGRIFAAMTAAKAAMSELWNGAKILGVHMEGPYLNVDYTGAQNPNYVRRADHDEMKTLFELDVIRLLALATEFEENHWLIRECEQRGITTSSAHSSATYQDIQHAVKLGLSQATHTYNAMTGLHHRNPGTVGAVLTMPQIRAELIADNIHVHPVAMKILWQCKGKDGVILISDAIRAAGMPDGGYSIDERVVTVKDSAVRLPDGTLAGSILTMEVALRNFMAATGEPLENIWQTSSLNAARAIHESHQRGSIEANKSADLILVDEDINVYLTMVEGRIVYERLNDYAPAR